MKRISFKKPLLTAVIEGRKMQTRRIIKPQPSKEMPFWADRLDDDGQYWRTARYPEEWGGGEWDMWVGRINPEFKYKVGEVVYIQEPGIKTSEGTARHFIRITGARTKKLQDISDEDCIKEGIRHDEANPGYTGWYSGTLVRDTHQAAYAALIDKIYGRGTWDSNPWVWVFDYELCEKPESPPHLSKKNKRHSR